MIYVDRSTISQKIVFARGEHVSSIALFLDYIPISY